MTDNALPPPVADESLPDPETARTSNAIGPQLPLGLAVESMRRAIDARREAAPTTATEVRERNLAMYGRTSLRFSWDFDVSAYRDGDASHMYEQMAARLHRELNLTNVCDMVSHVAHFSSANFLSIPSAPALAPLPVQAPVVETGTCECSYCNEEFDKADAWKNQQGDYVCEGCKVDHYFECYNCNDVEHNDNNAGQDHRGHDICSSCAERSYVYSEPMGCLITSGRARRSTDGNYATSDYARENWYYGARDGEWYESEEDCDENNQTDDETAEENGLFGYHDKDVIDVCGWDKRNKRDALVFGVELEMEPREYECQSGVTGALNGPIGEQYILMHDGSLEDGVELITVPLTLEQHRKDFDWQGTLKPVLGIAKSGAGTDRCGMHVHINRKALSPLLIGKIMVFLNSPYLEQHMVTIAQRDSNSYCQSAAKKLTAENYDHDRYGRTNLTDATLEIRMFRGNLRYQRVLKNIEFCDAMVHYLRECSMRDVESWIAFTCWLLKHKHEYPELVAFLDETETHGFVGAARLSRVNKKTGMLVKAPVLTEEV